MNLETPAQRIAVYAISIAFLATLVIVFGAVVSSLSDTNQTRLGDWLGTHWSTIWKTGIALLPAVIAFLFGRSSGRKSGKTEAFNHAIATAHGTPTADTLRREAKSAGVAVTT
jgi:hypothetical protein